MITKDEFIKFLNAIKQQEEHDQKFSENLEKSFIDFQGWYDNSFLFDTIDSFLRNEMQDIGGWIDYFRFDLEFGSKWTKDSCSEKDGTIIDISTLDKLYDFLIRNMNG